MSETKKIAIGLVINQIEGKYQSQIYRGLSDYTENEGMDLYVFVGRSLSSPYGNEDQHNSIYSLAKTRRLDGLVVTAGSIGSFVPVSAVLDFLAVYAPVPIVTIGMSLPGIPSILTDNRNGIRAIMKHLVESHRARRIAFVGGPETSQEANERLAGYREALAENGLEEREAIMYPCDFSYQGSQQVAESILLDDGIPFDAVIAANDEMALGFMSAMKRRGVRAPIDYLITGFDNVPEVEKCEPALTTVSQPIYEEAVLAGKALVALIRGAEVAERTIIPAKPIPRGSCGCAESQTVIKRYPAQSSRETGEDDAFGKERLLASLSEGLAVSEPTLRKAREACGALFDSLALDLRSLRERPLFILALQDWLDITREWDEAPGVWRHILASLQNAVAKNTEEMRAHLYLEDLFKNAFALLANYTGREAGRAVLSLMTYLERFNDLSLSLEGASSGDDVIEAAYACATSLSLGEIAFCFHAEGARPIVNDNNSEKPYGRMRWQGLFREEELFPAETIVPDRALPQKAKAGQRHIVIMPMQGKSLSFGYIAFEGRRTEPILFDTFRDYVSRAFESLERQERVRIAEKSLGEAMARVSESGDRFRAMTETIPIPVMETTPSLAIAYANRAARNLLGLDGSPETLAAFIHRDDLKKVADVMKELARGMSLDFPGIRLVEPSSRRLIPILGIVGLNYGKEGQPAGILWNALDVRPAISGLLLPDQRFFDDRHLSERETEIARLMLQGFKTADIAERLFIAESTVKGHIGHVYDKCGVSNRAELIQLAHDEQSERYGFNAYVFSLLDGMLGQERHA